MNSCLHCFYENCHKMSFDKYNNVKERNMKPLNSLILIKYEEPTEKKTDSGLYVPQAVETVTAQNFLKEGTVSTVPVFICAHWSFLPELFNKPLVASMATGISIVEPFTLI